MPFLSNSIRNLRADVWWLTNFWIWSYNVTWNTIDNQLIIFDLDRQIHKMIWFREKKVVWLWKSSDTLVICLDFPSFCLKITKKITTILFNCVAKEKTFIFVCWRSGIMMRFRSINVNGPAPIADCLRYIQTGYPCTHFMFICKTCHFHFRSIIFYWYALRDIFSQCKNMKCSVEETYKKNVSLLILYFTKETKQKKKVQGRRAHIPCCMFIKMLDKMKFKSIIKITGCICNYIYNMYIWRHHQ